MNLYFLRHAKAFERSRKWKPDGLRPLTRDGEKKMFKIARGIHRLELEFDLIVTSPYVRAFRTAEILCEVLKSKKLLESEKLISEAKPEAIIDELNEHFGSFINVVLVGHEPYMTRLISLLLSGKENVPMQLRKGGLCKLIVPHLKFGRCATLDWLMTPSQLAALGESKH